jgi:predicted nucleotide-binding protein
MLLRCLEGRDKLLKLAMAKIRAVDELIALDRADTPWRSALGSADNSDMAAGLSVSVVFHRDVVEVRGEQLGAPRDNVILKLGMFLGALGRHRTFAFLPREIAIRIAIRMPSDMSGVIVRYYDENSKRLGR